MNKKITVIELLNKIANGEEAPKQIKVRDSIFIWKVLENGTGYYNVKTDTGYDWFENYISLDNAEDLNTKVEILEDNTEEIEEIKGWGLATDYKDFETINHTLDRFGNKINELVKAIKEIRKDLNK